MSQKVSFVHSPQEMQCVSFPSSKLTPKYISFNIDSLRSLEEIKSENIFTKIKNLFVNIMKSIKNFFRSVGYRIFYCKAPPSDVELEYLHFQSKLEKVESYSEELLKKNIKPIVYIHLGQDVYERGNGLFRLTTWLLGKTFYELGKEATKKNYRVLIPYLKKEYQSKISELEKKIKNKGINQ